MRSSSSASASRSSRSFDAGTAEPVSRYSGSTPSRLAIARSALRDGFRPPFSIREMYA